MYLRKILLNLNLNYVYWVICISGALQVPYIKEIRKMNYKVFLLDKI